MNIPTVFRANSINKIINHEIVALSVASVLSQALRKCESQRRSQHTWHIKMWQYSLHSKCRTAKLTSTFSNFCEPINGIRFGILSSFLHHFLLLLLPFFLSHARETAQISVIVQVFADPHRKEEKSSVITVIVANIRAAGNGTTIECRLVLDVRPYVNVLNRRYPEWNFGFVRFYHSAVVPKHANVFRTFHRLYPSSSALSSVHKSWKGQYEVHYS